MVEFINATQARGEIERILNKAKSNIVMISPYIKINDDLISRLTDAGHRNVKITMVCREDDLNAGERTKLEQIPNLILRFNERVHAKCFYHDNAMVITSLNLYSSSLGDNREMGVLLHSDNEGDKAAFEDAKSEAQFIIRESLSDTSRPKHLPNETNQTPIVNVKPKSKFETKPKKETSIEDSIVKGISDFFGLGKDQNKDGFCIHCGGKISFKLLAPYCPDCYKIWAKYKDNTYKEKTCHKCGKPSQTSMKYPLCPSCHKNII